MKDVEDIATQYLDAAWRAVPSANILDQLQYSRAPIRYVILSEGKWGSENTPVLVAGDLCEEVANRIVKDHNESLDRTTHTGEG